MTQCKTQKSPILIIDDDPSHLHIYCLVLESAGFCAQPVLVTRKGIELPEIETPHAVLLDYCLTVGIRARDIARLVKSRYPTVPILLLSDLPVAPADIEPFIKDFVRKGNPEQLVTTLHGIVRPAGSGPAPRLLDPDSRSPEL
ncbi:MAG TPA: response regulator [Acidobacteriaceae bacterium]|jgi:DNA-binding NtrC family response regulator|nr:response regulator [Acidobacteriaceae bacterium]